jgi:hypothetical protein
MSCTDHIVQQVETAASVSFASKRPAQKQARARRKVGFRPHNAEGCNGARLHVQKSARAASNRQKRSHAQVLHAPTKIHTNKRKTHHKSPLASIAAPW